MHLVTSANFCQWFKSPLTLSRSACRSARRFGRTADFCQQLYDRVKGKGKGKGKQGELEGEEEYNVIMISSD